MLSERLRAIRRGRGDTLKSLADALNKTLTNQDKAIGRNFSASQIGNWERGDRNPSIEDLQTVADYFDVSTDYLIGRDKTSVSDLQRLLMTNAHLNFDDYELTAQDRYEIFQLIRGYLRGRRGRDADHFNMPMDYNLELDLFDQDKE